MLNEDWSGCREIGKRGGGAQNQQPGVLTPGFKKITTPSAGAGSFSGKIWSFQRNGKESQWEMNSGKRVEWEMEELRVKRGMSNVE